jgi:bifunctional isochorismate lyase/aryl carrier protein
MKEAYFTKETISEQAADWIDLYGNPRKAASQPFDIKRAGLLILDMQRYFLEQDSHAYVPGGQMIVPGLKRLAGKFREAGRPVIATRHENKAGSAGMMASWWSELITRDHPLVDIYQDLEILPGEILQKSQYDAFYNSSLKKILHQNGVEQVVIGGVMTHLCCETTARSAFVQGLEVFFLVDGTATYNQGYHTATLRNLAHGVAVLISVEKLMEKV